jgi:Domain of unknown function (DUF4276)
VTQIVVYVEGPSDKAAMEALLAPLLERLRRGGIAVDFFDAPSGDRKKAVLQKVPEKALNILRNAPDAFVIALPDLYPKNHGFPHVTFEELVAGIRKNFRHAMDRKGVRDERLEARFQVFCFKHDLEALVLAAHEALKARLQADDLAVAWTLPVEDVDHGRPPKRVVEEIFASHGQRYKDTVDAPMILGASRYETVAARCPQCFGPFVAFLTGMREKGDQ